MVVLQDHMWQHRQEERALTRAEMDVVKQRRNLEDTMRKLNSGIQYTCTVRCMVKCVYNCLCVPIAHAVWQFAAAYEVYSVYNAVLHRAGQEAGGGS